MSDAAEPGPISQGLRDARADADLVFRHFRHGPGPTDDAPLYQSSLPGSADLDDADLPSSQLIHQRLHQLNDADNNDIAVHADESGASFLFDTANSNNTLFTPWASQEVEVRDAYRDSAVDVSVDEVRPSSVVPSPRTPTRPNTAPPPPPTGHIPSVVT